MTSPPASPRPPSFERIPLSGIVERITFHNPTTGFAVLKIRARGQTGLVSLVGQVASVSTGEHVEASGAWETSRTHGRQFRARHLEVTPPSTVDGMERYLGSGLIRGIGPTYAKRLVKAFGENVFDVIEKEPRKLRDVDGIGPQRAARIIDGWGEQGAIRQIMVFLQSHGISTARAVRIYKTYGADAIPLVTENPYRLARDLQGVGFRGADEIAGKLGIERTSPLRARAGLLYVLQEAVGRGHCALPRAALMEESGALLAIPRNILEEALEEELREKELLAAPIDGTECIFLPALAEAETVVEQSLRSLVTGRPVWHPIDSDRAVPWAEKHQQIDLSPSQRRALEKILSAKVSIVTGGPGVGKTTLVNALLEILRAKGVRVAMCAPTGRASKRLQESTGFEAKTIHRLLEASPQGFKRDADNPVDCDLLVVDEASMVDIVLMSQLLKALRASTAILLIGDVDQLPSVGPGRVLEDVINSGIAPVARLVEVFRQAETSSIVHNAHRLNAGKMPALEPGKDSTGDFYFVQSSTPESAARTIVRVVRDRIPRRFQLDPIRDVQVLCPMNRGVLGTRSLNVELQNALNPEAGYARVERFGSVFRPGDKVMQTANDYDKDVFNGDLATIESIDHEAEKIVLRFDRRILEYSFGELDQVTLAYATTIHKSQGSEYPAVVIPVSTQHFPMLRRNLFYTGVTRARRLVVLVGQTRALGIALGAGERDRRWTRLRELLSPSHGPD